MFHKFEVVNDIKKIAKEIDLAKESEDKVRSLRSSSLSKTEVDRVLVDLSKSEMATPMVVSPKKTKGASLESPASPGKSKLSISSSAPSPDKRKRKSKLFKNTIAAIAYVPSDLASIPEVDETPALRTSPRFSK